MKKWLLVCVAVLVVIIAGVFLAEMRYKYSCTMDPQCYPCTRWMNCVSEGFYLRNTARCRIGDEENFSRIMCGCARSRCVTRDVRPWVAPSVRAWVPSE